MMGMNSLLRPLGAATAAAVVVALGGCASPAADNTTVAFSCDDGSQGLFRVVEGGETAVMTLDRETIELERQETASGAKYGRGGVVFWNKGDEALLLRPSSPDTACRLARMRRAP